MRFVGDEADHIARVTGTNAWTELYSSATFFSLLYCGIAKALKCLDMSWRRLHWGSVNQRRRSGTTAVGFLYGT